MVDLECTKLSQRDNFVYFTALRNFPLLTRAPAPPTVVRPCIRQETHAWLSIFFGPTSGLGVDQNNETRRDSPEIDTDRKIKYKGGGEVWMADSATWPDTFQAKDFHTQINTVIQHCEAWGSSSFPIHPLSSRIIMMDSFKIPLTPPHIYMGITTIVEKKIGGAADKNR